MILVTGATGTIGTALVGELLARGAEVTAVTRNPAKIQPRGHLTITTGIGPADAVFLLAPPGPGLPEADRAMLAAAIDAGCRRLVKLSAIATPDHDDDTALIGSWHRPGEKAVRASGLPWTILRPSTFASNTLAWAGDIGAGRPVPNPFGDGKQGVVDPRDIAAVAAETLLNPGHEGRVYTLTGPDLISVPDQAAQLAEVLGKPIELEDILLDETDMYGAGAALVRRGGNAVVTPDVEQVLGRGPRTFRAWAEDNKHRF
jgi:uncharacterized protein YbjT (DUF2867 family)